MSISPSRIVPLPRPVVSGRLALLLSAAGGSLLMTLASHVAVPFWPVPLTMQSVTALGLGAVLGPVPAMLAILVWIGEGAVGLPVFATGTGPSVLSGPTAGYILGFLPAAALAGVAARHGWLAKPWTTALAFVAADAVLFAIGVTWLTVLFGWDKALMTGLVPFLIGEALKVGVATAVVTGLAGWRARRS